MKKLLLLAAVLFTANTTFAGENCEGPRCRPGTTSHEAGHVLDVYMGGYRDRLYVCEIEILGHQCEGKYQDVNMAADYLTTINGGSSNNFQNLVVPGTNGKKISINAKQWQSLSKPANLSEVGGGRGFFTQLHLNSFRYGSIYRVTYCFDYQRQTTEGDHGNNEGYNHENRDFLTNSYDYDQAGWLKGFMKMFVKDMASQGPSYWNEAHPKVRFDFECNDRPYNTANEGEHAVGPFSTGMVTTGPLGSVTSHTWSLDSENIMIPLDYDTRGQCKFHFTFKEDKVGQLRKFNEGKTFKSWIKTKVKAGVQLTNHHGYNN